MFTIEKTYVFDKWLRGLRDERAKAKILFRIQKLGKDGHFGDFEHVGEGIRELKIDYSKGYRIYFAEFEKRIIVLINGGHKSTQRKDIERAKTILKRIEKEGYGNFKI